jgi:hypothetical protein
VFQLPGDKVIPVDAVETKEPEIAFIVCLDPIDLYEGVDDTNQFFLLLVKYKESILSSCPQGAGCIAEEAVDHIAAQGFGVGVEEFEVIPVKAVEPFLCAEPEEAILILCAAEDGAIGESVLHLVVSEIIGLSVCPEADDDKQQCREYVGIFQM